MTLKQAAVPRGRGIAQKGGARSGGKKKDFLKQ